MTLLATLRKMVFGETWELPVGVALSLAGTSLLVDRGHRDAAGLILILLIATVLAFSVNRSARSQR